MKTSTKIALFAGSVAVVAAAIVGGYLLIKKINDENHQKDIEMAADCAQTFERPVVTTDDLKGRSGFVDTGAYTKAVNNRNAKREECAQKYHVTHQEIIDKIGTENYNSK